MPSHAKAMTQAPHATLLSTSQGTGEVALLVWLPRKVSDAPALACALPAHIHERAMRRPGRVVGVCSAPADEVSRRTWWRMQAGWQLPAARMFWLDVSFAADGDDAEAVAAAVPACCVGSPTGLTLQRARGAAAAAVLSRLAGEAHHWLHVWRADMQTLHICQPLYDTVTCPAFWCFRSVRLQRCGGRGPERSQPLLGRQAHGGSRCASRPARRRPRPARGAAAGGRAAGSVALGHSRPALV